LRSFAADDSDLPVTPICGDRLVVDVIPRSIRPLVIRYCRARLGRTEQTFASADDGARRSAWRSSQRCRTSRPGQALPPLRLRNRRHKVIDAYRAAWRTRSEPCADVPDSPDASDRPEQYTLRFESSTEPGRLLQVLPEKQREILILRVVIGLSAGETAEVVGSTPGAVRVAQRRALTRLRKTMTEARYETGPF
jgi:RNA polymerase sigma-70 factor, ECF subfamily